MNTFPQSNKCSCCRLTALGLALLLVSGCAHQQVAPKVTDADRLKYEMAEALVQNQAYEEAVPYIRSLLKRRPRSARLHLLLGIVLRERGIYIAAEREIRFALEIAPRRADGHNALGILLTKTKQLKEAIEHHQIAVKYKPMDRYYNDLGVALFAKGDHKKARQALEEAIRINPSFRRAYNNLGFVYGAMGKEDKAEHVFSQVGSRAMVLTNLGYIKEMQGQPSAARRLYELALREQNNYEPALQNLRVLEPGRWPDRSEAGDLQTEQLQREHGERNTPAANAKSSEEG